METPFKVAPLFQITMMYSHGWLVSNCSGNVSSLVIFLFLNSKDFNFAMTASSNTKLDSR